MEKFGDVLSSLSNSKNPREKKLRKEVAEQEADEDDDIPDDLDDIASFLETETSQ
jgi:hypothetical protein